MDDLGKRFYEVTNATLNIAREFKEKLRTVLEGALEKFEEDLGVKKINNKPDSEFNINNLKEDTAAPKTKEEALRELERIKEEIARQPGEKRITIKVETVSENVKKKNKISDEEELIEQSASKLKDDQYESSSLSDKIKYKISKVIDDLKEPIATTSSADDTKKESTETGGKSEGESSKAASEDKEKQKERNYLWIFVT
ncbi:hypothetical protein ILUMI_02897 [Ignelater luminosus]|uniref:Uncharacterized protein n=1 Tax=Ignelater luminosus TaxID=2038154 RepID=A0A8K0GKZ0_IGNLU|nr:hypothetical protein ILUMI_02897 [Ignelater luminosus]